MLATLSDLIAKIDLHSLSIHDDPVTGAGLPVSGHMNRAPYAPILDARDSEPPTKKRVWVEVDLICFRLHRNPSPYIKVIDHAGGIVALNH